MAKAKIEIADQAEAFFLLNEDDAGIVKFLNALDGIIRRCIVRYNHLNIGIGLGKCAADGSKSQLASVDGRNSDGDSSGDRHDGLVTNVSSRVACDRESIGG